MADWIDILGDVIFRVAEPFIDSNRPKRLVGILFIALTVFAVLGTLAAVALGAKLGLIGYCILIPLLLITASIGCFCFSTDRDPGDS